MENFLKRTEDLYAPFMDAIAAKQLDINSGMQQRKEALALLKAFEAGFRRP